MFASDQALIERQLSGNGLTRPELAVLLAYTKIYLKEEILKSGLPDNPFIDDILASAFPERISRDFSTDLKAHPLRTEIIATQLSNRVLNVMGITFPFRLQDETALQWLILL